MLPSMPPAMRPIVPQSVAMSGPAVGCDPVMPRHVQMEALLWENERLKKELDAQQDISSRIQRVSVQSTHSHTTRDQLTDTLGGTHSGAGAHPDTHSNRLHTTSPSTVVMITVCLSLAA